MANLRKINEAMRKKAQRNKYRYFKCVLDSELDYSQLSANIRSALKSDDSILGIESFVDNSGFCVKTKGFVSDADVKEYFTSDSGALCRAIKVREVDKKDSPFAVDPES